MFIYCAFVFIGKRNYFIYKCSITAFSYILVNSREKPQCIICPVCRMSCFLYIRCIIWRVLMPWVVCILNKRKPCTIINLCRKHKTYLLFCHLRCKMDYPLYILYCIPVSITVAQPAVNK